MARMQGIGSVVVDWGCFILVLEPGMKNTEKRLDMIVTWENRMRKMLIEGRPQKSLCHDCHQCCVEETVLLTPEDNRNEFKYDTVYNSEFEQPVLRQKKNGECIYLDEEKQCSIYENRPKICKAFDCRVNEFILKKIGIKSRDLGIKPILIIIGRKKLEEFPMTEKQQFNKIHSNIPEKPEDMIDIMEMMK